MASMSITSSFLGGCSAAVISKQLPTNTGAASPRCGLVMVKAASSSGEGEMIAMSKKEESSNGRRELVFAVAAAAACSVAKVAMADEPKPGTPEAKKKYSPICVTMPTARICRK